MKDETKQFCAIKTDYKAPPRRNAGIFTTAFVLTVVLCIAVLAVMLIDYRGRTISMGNIGSIFEYSNVDQNTDILTLFGYDFTVDRLFFLNIAAEFLRIGEYIYFSVPLYLRIYISKIPHYFNLLCQALCDLFGLIL